MAVVVGATVGFLNGESWVVGHLVIRALWQPSSRLLNPIEFRISRRPMPAQQRRLYQHYLLLTTPTCLPSFTDVSIASITRRLVTASFIVDYWVHDDNGAPILKSTEITMTPSLVSGKRFQISALSMQPGPHSHLWVWANSRRPEYPEPSAHPIRQTSQATWNL